MFEYRQIIVRMRLGDSDRALARAGLIGRPKAQSAAANCSAAVLAGYGSTSAR